MTHEQIHQAAGDARMTLMRLGGDDGILSQIEQGEWDHRLDHPEVELERLLYVIGERARLDRIVIDRLCVEAQDPPY